MSQPTTWILMKTFGYTKENQPTGEQLAALPVQERRSAFLEATATFYTSKNRGMPDFGGQVHPAFGAPCVYRALPHSPGCAIGRWLSPTLANSLVGSVETYHDRLPGWMQEMGAAFLTYVQNLHDNQLNWDENGLTDRARREVDARLDRLGIIARAEEVKLLRQAVLEEQNRVEMLKKHNREIQEQKSDLSDQLDKALAAGFAAANKRLDDALNDPLVRHRDLASDNKKLNDELAAATRQMKDLETRHSILTENNKQINGEREVDYKRLIDAYRANNKRLKDELASDNKDNKDLKQALAESQAGILSLEGSLKQVSRDFKERSQANSVLHRELSEVGDAFRECYDFLTYLHARFTEQPRRVGPDELSASLRGLKDILPGIHSRHEAILDAPRCAAYEQHL